MPDRHEPITNAAPLPSGLKIVRVDYQDPEHAAALVTLLDEYARSEYGGGEPLAEAVKAVLPERLAAMPQALSVLAWLDDEPVGLLNAFETLSTFKARPLLNIHDIAVTAHCRGQGIGTALLSWLEDEARTRGCCKLTLEVLEGNHPAQSVYRRFGFAAYELDEAFGRALFWEKPIKP